MHFFNFFLTITKSKIVNLYVHVFSRIFNQSQKYLRENKKIYYNVLTAIVEVTKIKIHLTQPRGNIFMPNCYGIHFLKDYDHRLGSSRRSFVIGVEVILASLFQFFHFTLVDLKH